MDETGFSAAMARIERAVVALEAGTDAVATRLASMSENAADTHLRAEVQAVIDELDAMLGERRG